MRKDPITRTTNNRRRRVKQKPYLVSPHQLALAHHSHILNSCSTLLQGSTAAHGHSGQQLRQQHMQS
jgi:hypothetical protein